MKLLTSLHAALRKIERKTSPFSGDVAARDVAHWVKPEIVVEVRFSEWTRDGYLRQPAFLGLRPDKAPGEVVAEIPSR